MTGGFLLLAGVLLGHGSVAMPAMWWMVVGTASTVLVFATPLRRRAALMRVALLLSGMLLAWSSTHQWLALRVPVSAADTRVLIEGRVRSVPAREGGQLHFDLAATIVDGRGGAGLVGHDARIRIARLVWRDAGRAPQSGERWRLLVRLSPAAGTRNFAGADPARFAFRDRVHLAGRVLPSTLNARLALAPMSIDTLRARIAARIRDQVADPDAAALLTALAVGLTDQLSADQWRVFNSTGTTHLVAISGLHVTLFALAALFVARFAWRWIPFARLVEREPFALLLGLAAAGAYSLLAGISVPTQRTWLMLGTVALSRLAARHAGSGRTWSLALIAVLLIDPNAPLAAGFWLSFVAVGVILAAASEASGRSSAQVTRAAIAVRMQIAIMLVLAPLTFVVFGGLSIAGLWVNLIAIPLISFVLVPLVLAGVVAILAVPALSPFAFGAAAKLYDLSWPWLAWAADSEFALWRATPQAWWFAFGLGASLMLLRRWPWALRFPAACAALPLLFAPPRMPEAGTARVSILDAGRGTAVLVTTHSHVLLFDTGDSWNTRGGRVREVVLPALDALGRRSVDLLVLPTLSADRAHGAAMLAFERQVRQLRVGGGWPAASLPAAACEDSAFEWDGVHFQTFAAGSGGRYCLVRMSVGARGILLAGDLDIAAERELLRRLPRGTLATDVVLVSRHGSSMASAPEWIEATAAGTAIAAGGVAGTQSREMALARWRRSGARVLETRRDGGIELGFGPDETSVLRANVSRYPFVWRRVQ